MKDSIPSGSNIRSSLKFLLLLFTVNSISHFRYFKKFDLCEEKGILTIIGYLQIKKSPDAYSIVKSYSII